MNVRIHHSSSSSEQIWAASGQTLEASEQVLEASGQVLEPSGPALEPASGDSSLPVSGTLDGPVGPCKVRGALEGGYKESVKIGDQEDVGEFSLKFFERLEEGIEQGAFLPSPRKEGFFRWPFLWKDCSNA